MSVSLSEDEHNDHATMARRLFSLANDPLPRKKPKRVASTRTTCFPGEARNVCVVTLSKETYAHASSTVFQEAKQEN